MTVADLRPGLRAYLLADSSIAARVGARVYPVLLDQGETQDSIVYSRISDVGDHHMQGPSGLARPRMQIDCWSRTADGAASLARLVKGRIDGFRGAMPYGPGSPQDAIDVKGVFFDAARDGYDDTLKLHRVSQDFFIWFSER